MSSLNIMTPQVIATAYNRIKNHIHQTPLLKSDFLDVCLQSKLFFKFEGAQKVGAFKARGALNTLLRLKEQNELPKEIVAFSSGNHSQAVAWAAKQLGVKATIILPEFTAKVKIEATRSYGAQIILTKERQEAEDLAKEKSKHCFLLPPYDHDDVIAGQGTATFEAWATEGNFDAVFAPCGGGGLISGTYLGTRLFSDTAKVYACEPQISNDAAESFKTGKIKRFEKTQMTIADGARTLGVCERTFQYIKNLNGFYEVSEEQIIYWTQWITHLLKVNAEPTAALSLAGAYQWIKSGNYQKKILIILSGGNIDSNTYLKIWENNFLEDVPQIK